MNGLFMLTIKDTSNKMSEYDLFYITNYIIKSKIGQSDIIKYEFEHGKQDKIHIHCICKSLKLSIPHGNYLTKYLHKYKIYNKNKEEIPTKSIIIHVSPIKDENHLNNCYKYILKEKINCVKENEYNCEFID
jgi:hypothetical protein